MKIIDISWPIANYMTTYKDKHSIKLQQTEKEEADFVRESMLCFSAHTGTHVDGPSHFLKDGKPIEKFNLQQLIGECIVLDCMGLKDKIIATDLQGFEIKENDIVLFKTKNSNLPSDAPFDYNFVYVDESAANYLISKQIKAVGIDYLGIERNQPKHETHKLFLKNDIPIIEGLRLEGVKQKRYQLYCLPLKLIGLEAAPARAILIEK